MNTLLHTVFLIKIRLDLSFSFVSISILPKKWFNFVANIEISINVRSRVIVR